MNVLRLPLETRTGDADRCATIRRVAQRWNDVGVEYGAVHGAEDFPRRLGRDLDVLVAPADVGRAERLASEAMRDDGWGVYVLRTPWKDTWLRGIRRMADGSFQSLEIDLLTRLRWAWIELASAPLPEVRCVKRGALRQDPWAGFVKRVLLLVLSGQLDRLADGDRLRIPADELPEVVAGLRRTLGSISEDFWAATDRRDVAWIRRHLTGLRRATLLRSLRRHPPRAVRGTGAWLRNEMALGVLSTRAVPIIAVVGPDGVGKTSSLNALAELLRTELRVPGVQLRHWRPEVLPSLGKLAGRRSEGVGSRPPRRSAGRFPAFRIGYYALDHVLGFLTRERIASSRAFPVCYDRCLLDMAVDPLRFGLRSGRGVAKLWRRLPRPDLIVLLADDPHRIRSRKPELDAPEIARQLDSWRALVRSGDVHAEIEVGADPKDTARKLLSLYVGAFDRMGAYAD